MFPAITQEGGTQRGKATCKTDKGSSKEKETKKSWAEADDSDDDEFLNQLLHDRPPPYALNDNRPSTSAGLINSTQNQGTTNTVQVNTVATSVSIQNSVSVSTAPEMQTQLQPPPVQRLYPDVPILETTTSLVVPSDPTYTRPKLIQTEPTPLLLPQTPQQMVPNYTSVTVPQLASAPITNQNMGANAPQVLGNRQLPAASCHRLTYLSWSASTIVCTGKVWCMPSESNDPRDDKRRVRRELSRGDSSGTDI
ncbi:hypothetical protein NDU88_008491 [Pleurodeles waltl]|uniref:Uncharacterized protein n=1 Tax=Pleurodeles waltl TaxID=8319 RepID=A0AAV7RVV9_PLEWA|nr:hypothetical protein NDU88_008491 [Pleurodeles waltl]